jgi:hypothetical protein
LEVGVGITIPPQKNILLQNFQRSKTWPWGAPDTQRVVASVKKKKKINNNKK